MQSIVSLIILILCCVGAALATAAPAAATLCASTTTVSPTAWETEDGAPTTGYYGLDFSTPDATSKVNWFGPALNVDFSSISGGAYSVSNTGGAIASYGMELHYANGTGFTTIVWEAYVNGLTGAGTSGDGTFHTYTIGLSSLVWNTHITSGAGSQQSPIPLSQMQALLPGILLFRAGISQGRSNAGSLSTVANFTDPTCGLTIFPTLTPSTSPSNSKSISPSRSTSPSVSPVALPTTCRVSSFACTSTPVISYGDYVAQLFRPQYSGLVNTVRFKIQTSGPIASESSFQIATAGTGTSPDSRTIIYQSSAQTADPGTTSLTWTLPQDVNNGGVYLNNGGSYWIIFSAANNVDWLMTSTQNAGSNCPGASATNSIYTSHDATTGSWDGNARTVGLFEIRIGAGCPSSS